MFQVSVCKYSSGTKIDKRQNAPKNLHCVQTLTWSCLFGREWRGRRPEISPRKILFDAYESKPLPNHSVFSVDLSFIVVSVRKKKAQKYRQGRRQRGDDLGGTMR